MGWETGNCHLCHWTGLRQWQPRLKQTNTELICLTCQWCFQLVYDNVDQKHEVFHSARMNTHSNSDYLNERHYFYATTIIFPVNVYGALDQPKVPGLVKRKVNVIGDAVPYNGEGPYQPSNKPWSSLVTKKGMMSKSTQVTTVPVFTIKTLG